jgi:uncharacterized lipoprotein YajG
VAQLSVSDNIARAQCVTKLGAKVQPFQLTVVDARPNPSVGSLKKGDTVSDVMLAEKVTSVFDKALRAALTNCGYRLAPTAPAKVTVTVTEFFAGGAKSLLKAETKASGRIMVRIDQNGMQQDMEFGLDASDTGMRTGKLKQLQGTLETVLKDTVTQMVTSQSFVDGLK